MACGTNNSGELMSQCVIGFLGPQSATPVYILPWLCVCGRKRKEWTLEAKKEKNISTLSHCYRESNCVNRHLSSLTHWPSFDNFFGKHQPQQIIGEPANGLLYGNRIDYGLTFFPIHILNWVRLEKACSQFPMILVWGSFQSALTHFSLPST